MFSGRTAILALVGRDPKPSRGPMLRGNCTAEKGKRKCRNLERCDFHEGGVALECRRALTLV
jgi:hypothetical protein